MAKAYVEIDGLELDIDEYADYIDTAPIYEFDPSALPELNERFGFPDASGAQL